VAGHADAARAADVQALGVDVIVAGQDRQAVDRLQLVRVGLLTASMPSIWASSASRSGGMLTAVRPGML